MAEIARKYHEGLQDEGSTPKKQQKEAINESLKILTTKLPIQSKRRLAEKTTEQEISKVLTQLPNGKATGIDGLPYELWKCLINKPKSEEKDEKCFNIARTLARVYNDIEEHGVAENTGFAEGNHPTQQRLQNPNQSHRAEAGRSITDQIRLTQMIVNYAEVEEIAGVVVALDQEKAYDKITHKYLWKTMRAYGLPKELINMTGPSTPTQRRQS